MKRGSSCRAQHHENHSGSMFHKACTLIIIMQQVLTLHWKRGSAHMSSLLYGNFNLYFIKSPDVDHVNMVNWSLDGAILLHTFSNTTIQI